MKQKTVMRDRRDHRYSYLENISEERRKLNPLISNFLTERNVPDWFRGTSVFQMQAADDLHNAIQDDIAQSTSHRVRNALEKIGINPNITAGDARTLLRLSRGNDLAFLWFLLERHYKTPEAGYSVNEQLIMSSIAHLDMVTTLRELDRILPPPTMGKREFEKRTKKGQTKETDPKNMEILKFKRAVKQHFKSSKDDGVPRMSSITHVPLEPRLSQIRQIRLFRERESLWRLSQEREMLMRTSLAHPSQMRLMEERISQLYLPLVPQQRDSTLPPVPKLPSRHERIAPYFEKLPRPKSKSKTFKSHEPHFAVNMFDYECYSDPRYKVPNEVNRWFTNYELQPEKRIAEQILHAEINNIFNEYAGAEDKSEKVEALCEYHKQIRSLEESLEHKLKVIARDRCLGHFDLDKRKRERQQRIKDKLDRDVEQLLKKFNLLANKTEEDIVVMTVTNGNDYQFQIVTGKEIENASESLIEIIPAPTTAKHAVWSKRTGSVTSVSNKYPSNRNTEMRKSILKRPTNGKRYESTAAIEGNTKAVVIETSMEIEKNKELKSEKKEYKLSQIQSDNKNEKKMPLSGRGDGQDVFLYTDYDCENKMEHKEVFKSVDNMLDVKIACPQKTKTVDDKQAEKAFNSQVGDGGFGAELPASTSSESTDYFQAPQANKPYLFDYNKIFDIKQNDEPTRSVKRIALDAIDSKLKLPHKMTDSAIDVNKVVKDYVLRTWRTKVANIRSAMQAEREQRYEQKSSSEENLPFDYGLDYYDPDDKQLMNRMLKDALEYMSKNRKFVLATLPNSHNIPILNEWIAKRYGKMYTSSECVKSFNLSTKIYKALEEVVLNVPLPTSSELGKHAAVDYSCRDYLYEKSNLIKTQYYNRLDAALMHQARVFWFTLRPYIRSHGSPRNTYYAYMPARIQDIIRVNIWKPDEFMDARSAWVKRMNKKRIMEANNL